MTRDLPGAPVAHRRERVIPARDGERALARELAAFARGAIDPADFDHTAHLRVAFAMAGRYAFDEALARYSRGLRRLCARAGRPDRFHMTITVAFLALVAERRADADAPGPPETWATFAARNPDLLDRGCLERWYDRATLASARARQGFVLPTVRQEVIDPVHLSSGGPR